MIAPSFDNGRSSSRTFVEFEQLVREQRPLTSTSSRRIGGNIGRLSGEEGEEQEQEETRRA